MWPQHAVSADVVRGSAGDGARSCVGSRLALLEAKVALIHLFRNLSFRLAPGQVPLKLVNTLTLSPADGVWVYVDRRSNAIVPEQ